MHIQVVVSGVDDTIRGQKIRANIEKVLRLFTKRGVSISIVVERPDPPDHHTEWEG